MEEQTWSWDADFACLLAESSSDGILSNDEPGKPLYNTTQAVVYPGRNGKHSTT